MIGTPGSRLTRTRAVKGRIHECRGTKVYSGLGEREMGVVLLILRDSGALLVKTVEWEDFQ